LISEILFIIKNITAPIREVNVFTKTKLKDMFLKINKLYLHILIKIYTILMQKEMHSFINL